MAELSECRTCEARYCKADSWACACDVPILPTNVVFINRPRA
jgi:hypothetical protein